MENPTRICYVLITFWYTSNCMGWVGVLITLSKSINFVSYKITGAYIQSVREISAILLTVVSDG